METKIKFKPGDHVIVNTGGDNYNAVIAEKQPKGTKDYFWDSKGFERAFRVRFENNTTQYIDQSSIRFNLGKMKHIEVEFEGIDDWHRPVFRDLNNNRYGSCDYLYSYNELDKMWKELTGDHLVYFGSKFNCEPMGTIIKKGLLKLVKKFSETVSWLE
jgi:hypothetical protein